MHKKGPIKLIGFTHTQEKKRGLTLYPLQSVPPSSIQYTTNNKHAKVFTCPPLTQNLTPPPPPKNNNNKSPGRGESFTARMGLKKKHIDKSLFLKLDLDTH